VLTEAGQRFKTSAAEIETVRSIDRNLALLFWVIAAAGMAGYSLGASLWANTDRKRRELSVLRLLAFRGGREEVQRHEKTDGLPGREVGRQHAVDDPSRSRYTNTAPSYPRTAVKSAWKLGRA